MADQGADRGGFRGGAGGDRGGDRGGRGGGRGGGAGGPPRRREEEWNPVTKLGRLVKHGKIKTFEEIFTHSIPIKESQIIDFFVKDLEDEVMKVMTVQKQTTAGQRTRFKAVIAVGDKKGHVGIGVKVAKEVQTAIRDGIKVAKLSVVPVRRGYWGKKIGEPHTIPNKISGKTGSVMVRLIPAPRGTGIVGSPTTKKILGFAGVEDCYSSSRGATRTKENFIKALYQALAKLYGYLTPDLWQETELFQSPFEKNSKFLQDYQAELDKKGRGGRGRGRGRGGRGRGGRGGGRGRGGPRGGEGRGGEGRGRGAPRGAPRGGAPATAE